jgi:hypothetical protein
MGVEKVLPITNLYLYTSRINIMYRGKDHTITFSVVTPISIAQTNVVPANQGLYQLRGPETPVDIVGDSQVFC